MVVNYIKNIPLFLLELNDKKYFKTQIKNYLNSILLALKPFLCICVFLHSFHSYLKSFFFFHSLHSYLKSVFFVAFFPVILNLEIAGFEYLPLLPMPLAWPLRLALTFEPYVKLLGALFFDWLTLCSVCFLQNGQYLLTVLGIFISN